MIASCDMWSGGLQFHVNKRDERLCEWITVVSIPLMNIEVYLRSCDPIDLGESDFK